MRDMCEYREELTGDEIHKMIGIMSVNSLEIELGEEMGFYPTFSNINHSYLANAKPVKLKEVNCGDSANKDKERNVEQKMVFLVFLYPVL